MSEENKKDLTKTQLFFNNVRYYLSKPENVLTWIFFISLAVLIIYPIIEVILSSLRLDLTDSRLYSSLFGQKLKKGALSLNNIQMLLNGKYSKEYSAGFFWKPLWNSVKMSFFASFLAIFIGGVFAFLITRTDIRFKKFISSVFVFPYIMPSWTLALVWKNVFTNTEVGIGLKGLLQSLTGICVPAKFVYGLFPCSVVLGIHYAPFAYILIGGILRNMDANLEEAAVILKAKRGRIIRKVTIPIVEPAILSTILLVFSSTMASFSVPNFVGSPGNFFVLSTMLKSLYSSSFRGQAYVMSIVLIIFGIAFLVLNKVLLGTRRSYTTVSGKSGQISYIKIGKANTAISIFLVILVFFAAVFPMISFALESMLEVPGDYSTLTLKYWLSKENIDAYFVNVGKGLLFNKQVWSAMWGSIKLSVVVALVVGTCGMLIGYCVAKKRKSKLSGAVSSLAYFPHLIPTMAFGAIWLAVSAKFTFLKGTMMLLVITGSIKYLPFASRSGTSAMLQLSGEIEEAAVLVGAPWIKRFTRILFPIQKSSFISGYLLPFVSCMRELTLFVLLAESGTLITTLLSFFDERNLTQMANGINLMIVLVVLLINFVVNKLTGASIDKGIGGN